MIRITAKDKELIAPLWADAREPVASLARKLGVSRTTAGGKFDPMAMVKPGSAEDMDCLIDDSGMIPGVTRIETVVILPTKLDRR
jgi:hypothetical protein